MQLKFSLTLPALFLFGNIFALTEETVPTPFQARCFDFTHIVEKGMSSMVKIEKKGGSFDTIYDGNQKNYRDGHGSGVIISPDGYIVTNYHVIRGSSKIFVVMSTTGRKYEVLEKWIDPETDLALLKVDAQNLSYLEFADSDRVKIGEWVALLGNPLAHDNAITIGVVSGKEIQDIGMCHYENYLRTNAMALPGNSGGPVLNSQGELIGIHVGHCSLSDRNIPVGIGFEIPSNLARHVVAQLMQEEKVKRGYLGADLKRIDATVAKALGMEEKEALVVLDVEDGSPASEAGLLMGDVIVGYADKADPKGFERDLALHMDPHSALSLKILRENELLDLTVQLGEQSRGEGICPEELKEIGIFVDDIHSERAKELGYDFGMKGVLITKVKVDSPADKAGLEPAFLITDVVIDLYDSRTVTTVDDLIKVVQEVKDKTQFIFQIRQPDRASKDYIVVDMELGE